MTQKRIENEDIINTNELRQIVDKTKKLEIERKIETKKRKMTEFENLKIKNESLKTENDLLKKRIEQLEVDLSISKKKEGFRFW
jgi:hypothetical protein